MIWRSPYPPPHPYACLALWHRCAGDPAAARHRSDPRVASAKHERSTERRIPSTKVDGILFQSPSLSTQVDGLLRVVVVRIRHTTSGCHRASRAAIAKSCALARLRSSHLHPCVQGIQPAINRLLRDGRIESPECTSSNRCLRPHGTFDRISVLRGIPRI